jgi:hypothetical protein
MGHVQGHSRTRSPVNNNTEHLKGPSLRYSAPGFLCTQIRPVWVGDLGTRPKIQQWDGFGLKIAILYFLAL